jgi:circadian clock protein KaiC
VIKKRSGRHETALRAFSMDDGGLQVRAALENYRGVMTGIPDYEQTVSELSRGE